MYSVIWDEEHKEWVIALRGRPVIHMGSEPHGEALRVAKMLNEEG